MTANTRKARPNKAAATSRSVKKPAKLVERMSKKGTRNTKRKRTSEESSDSPGETEDEGDAYKDDDDVESSEDVDEEFIHSDDLDGDTRALARKRKPGSQKAATPRRGGASPAKKRLKKKKDSDVDEASELELEEGQTIVGKLVAAPKTGRVPPGQISQNTLNFLEELRKPECNDREWFKLRDPVFRQAEKEWVAFVDNFTEKLSEIDDEIPPLPAKDVIHRIYRDIRFSNDKTPYKTNFSASWSRTGRKGIFAHYHISVSPGGRSIIAAGLWCPGKNELATLRSHITRDASRLKDVIENEEFVEIFGPAKPHPKGERQNVFGHEDELKVAPKGIDKNHKDIALLKVRSFAVVHRFLDSEVVDPKFAENLGRIAQVMLPFVHLLNDLVTVPPDDE